MPERALPAEVEDFIARSHAAQAVVEAGLDPAEVKADYLRLQMWDYFSLYICTNEILQPVTIDPGPGLPGAALRLIPQEDGSIAIDPYPFDVVSLTVGVRHRRLHGIPFANAADFTNAYFAQPQSMVSFTFVSLP